MSTDILDKNEKQIMIELLRKLIKSNKNVNDTLVRHAHGILVELLIK